MSSMYSARATEEGGPMSTVSDEDRLKIVLAVVQDAYDADGKVWLPIGRVKRVLGDEKADELALVEDLVKAGKIVYHGGGE